MNSSTSYSTSPKFTGSLVRMPQKLVNDDMEFKDILDRVLSGKYDEKSKGAAISVSSRNMGKEVFVRQRFEVIMLQ